MIYELKNCSKVNNHRRKPLTYEIDDDTGCWECGSHYINKDGYPQTWHSGKHISAHRAVFISYFNIINMSSKWVIRHICDNESCINPIHLLPGTIKDNNCDKVERGRSCKGIKNGRSKLTEKEVLEIKNNSIDNNIILGRKYNIDKRTILDIKLGKTWGWLK